MIKTMIGKRVLYKRGALIECWVDQITSDYIVLKPCWRTWKIKRYYVRDRTKILPYSRNPKKYQHVRIDHPNHFFQEGIIEEIVDDYLHVQIPGTRVYLKYHKDSPSIMLYQTTGNLITYDAIDLKKELNDPYMFANVRFNNMRGITIDYNSMSELYLVHTWCMRDKNYVWLPKNELQLESINFYVNNKPIFIGRYTIPYKSIYNRHMKEDEHLILRDMWFNHNWKQKFIKSILDMQFHMFHRCPSTSYVKDSRERMLELLKTVGPDMSSMVTIQMMNMNINRLAIEYSYRSMPHFTTKIHSMSDVIELDIYYNNNLTHPLAKKSMHLHTYYIDPVIKGLTNRKESKWEGLDTHSMEFWEEQWKVDIEKTSHPTLYSHQCWALKKMIDMEKTKISNIFDYNVFGQNYNMLNGFGKSVDAYGGVLALDTGLGKTVCLIYLMKQSPGKTLIVLPLSLMDQWKNEILMFYPEACISEYYGKKKSLEGDIVLTTYGTICNTVTSIEVDRVIFDECHLIKSCFSNTALTCSKIKARKRWCVTATPGPISGMATIMCLLNVNPFFTSSMDKYMQLLQERHRGLLGNLISSLFIVLKKKHMKNNPIQSKVTYKNIELEMEKPHSLLYNYMYKRTKEEIMKYWRENSGMRNFNKIMSAYNRLHMVAMHPKSLDYVMYGKTAVGAKKDCVESMVENMNNSTFEKNVAENIKNIESETCCICLEPFDRPVITPCHHLFCLDCIKTSLKHKKSCPQCRKELKPNSLTEIVKKIDLVENEDVYTFYSNGFKKEIKKNIHKLYNETFFSQKINYIKRQIKNNPNTSFVIFSQFNTCLNYLQKHLAMPVGKIDGKKTRKQRKVAIQKFKEREIKIFLLSTKTSSVGLTLTSSCHMIFMEPILEKQIFNQAIGRIHRIGQDKHVKVETLYSKNTIENIQRVEAFRNSEKSNSKKLKLEYFISI